MKLICRGLFISGFFFLCACAAEYHQPVKLNLGYLARGIWGGTSVQMTVAALETKIELDCALITVPGEILLNERNEFGIKGYYISEVGPFPIDLEIKGEPVLVQGSVSEDGEQLSLIVIKTINNLEAGRYTLRKNQEGFLNKCQ